MFELIAQSIASGVAIGCVYGLIGIGFCVIYNASGIVNFAQGAFVMLGGMVTYVGLTRYALPLPVAAGVSIAIVSVIGIALERLVVRPLWDRKSTMFVMILATLAAQIVIERLTLLTAGDQPRTLPMFTDFPPSASSASRSPTSFSGSSAARPWSSWDLRGSSPPPRPARRCAPARSTRRPPHCKGFRSHECWRCHSRLARRSAR